MAYLHLLVLISALTISSYHLSSLPLSSQSWLIAHLKMFLRRKFVADCMLLLSVVLFVKI